MPHDRRSLTRTRIAAAVFLLLLPASALMAAKTPAPEAATNAAPAVSKMKPGQYDEFAIALNGPVHVRTTLSEDRIEAVEIIESNEVAHIADAPMKQVAGEIVSAQSLSVDTVTGATRACEAVLRAVGQAVEKAGGSTRAFIQDEAPAAPETLPVRESGEADVVIVGGGASGLAAAAAALEAGARVVVLEKAAAAGGSAARSEGVLAAAGTDIQRAAGISASPESLAKLWLEDQKRSIPGAAAGFPDAARVEDLVRQSADTVKWLTEKVGLRFATDPAAADGIGPYALKPLAAAEGRPAGADQMEKLERYVRSLGGDIRTHAAAWQILRDENGRTAGVSAVSGKDRIEFRARSVVLATGGFGADLVKVTERQPRWAVFVERSAVPKANAGDGLVLAAAAGAREQADSWIISSRIAPGYPAMVPAMLGDRGFAGITLVNEHGKRFVREDLPDIANAVCQQLDTWLITDSRDPSKAKVLRNHLSFDTAVHGNSIEELARRMGVRAANLRKTIDTLNADAARGEDSTFGRSPENLAPITQAPFYAVKIHPVISGTMGGIVTNAGFQVLDATGKPIPGLWAAGEMANRPFYNRVYEEGTGLLIAFSSGRTAGAAAARDALGR